MDKPPQKDEFENLKKVLDRKTKEFEIIKQISSQINKTLTGGANISGSMLEHFLNQPLNKIDLKEHSVVKFFSKLDTFIDFINEGL